MGRIRSVVTVLALVLVLLGVFTPTRAHASDVTTPLIIGGAVAGAVAVVLLVAIMIESNREPDFLQFVPTQEPSVPPGFHLGTHCRAQDGTLPLFCW